MHAPVPMHVKRVPAPIEFRSDYRLQLRPHFPGGEVAIPLAALAVNVAQVIGIDSAGACANARISIFPEGACASEQRRHCEKQEWCPTVIFHEGTIQDIGASGALRPPSAAPVTRCPDVDKFASAARPNDNRRSFSRPEPRRPLAQTFCRVPNAPTVAFPTF